MVDDSKRTGALSALNHVIAVARSMAYDQQPHAHIAMVLDYADYLPMLMLEPEDRTESFRATLAGLASVFPGFERAVEMFDRNYDPFAARRPRS